MTPEDVRVLESVLQKVADALGAALRETEFAIEVLAARGPRSPRVVPMRQIEMAELMIASRNFSVPYAKCLVAASAQELMAQPDAPKDVGGLRPEDIARMEREMQAIEGDFRKIEESHGQNVLNLVVAAAYVRRLFDHASVVKYLSRKHGDLLAELERIVENTDLSSAGTEPAPATPSS